MSTSWTITCLRISFYVLVHIHGFACEGQLGSQSVDPVRPPTTDLWLVVDEKPKVSFTVFFCKKPVFCFHLDAYEVFSLQWKLVKSRWKLMPSILRTHLFQLQKVLLNYFIDDCVNLSLLSSSAIIIICVLDHLILFFRIFSSVFLSLRPFELYEIFPRSLKKKKITDLTYCYI